MNKKKIINDSVYGFFTIPYDIIFDLIEHRYFQRLRHIQQLGLSSFVYPGALHTRFHHALGATYLMSHAIETLRSKEVQITENEAIAVTIAILLHDIGHGPYSHALEHSLIPQVSHETLSLLFMKRLNKIFNNQLHLAIQIFENKYPKPFLHELVSSQLDMDRLDYLNRDSFYSGVREGNIGFDRIINMLDVKNNHLIVEHKGIYSIEKFLIARRLMYWQVYLHKTVIAAENMLLNILSRAKQLTQNNHNLFATPSLKQFLLNNYTIKDFEENTEVLDAFANLDDSDIFSAIKVWQNYPNDFVLSFLSKKLVERKLLKINLSQYEIDKQFIADLKNKAAIKYNLSPEELNYIVFTNSTSNSAYTHIGSQINIGLKNGEIQDITTASDLQNIAMLANPVIKYFVCYPKELMP